MTRPQVVPNAIAVLLLLGALGDHPYGYFTFLRWSVTIAAAVTAYVGFKSTTPAIGWLFIGGAIFFNPIAPIYLDRSTWQVVDVVAAFALGAAIVLQVRSPVAIDNNGDR